MIHTVEMFRRKREVNSVRTFARLFLLVERGQGAKKASSFD